MVGKGQTGSGVDDGTLDTIVLVRLGIDDVIVE